MPRTETENFYASSAYRSNSVDNLPNPKWISALNRNGLFNTHLASGYYAKLEPVMEVTTQLEADEHNAYERQQLAGDKPEVYCDARRWRFQNSGKVPHILFILNILCIPYSWLPWSLGIFFKIRPALGYGNISTELMTLIAFSTAVLMITSLTLYMTSKKGVHYLQLGGLVISAAAVLWVQGTLWGSSEMHIGFWLGTALYFMGAIGWDCLLWLYSVKSRHDGSEFNRVDGMVRFKRRFRPLYVAPFEEFDPVLMRAPSGHGSSDYALWLYHRYSSTKVCLAVKVHALGLDKPNALAFWDCLQRYMDVTQPLPDLPVLEQSRHLDPVTAAHDAQTGRNPRRWRDQSITGWKTGGERQLSEQLRRYPWQQQPCIIKARLSSALTIEDYYRALEARNIHITPKADDYVLSFDPDQA